MKTTKLTMKKNDIVIKNLNITQIKSKSHCPSLLMLTSLFVKTEGKPYIPAR